MFYFFILSCSVSSDGRKQPTDLQTIITTASCFSPGLYLAQRAPSGHWTLDAPLELSRSAADEWTSAGPGSYALRAPPRRERRCMMGPSLCPRVDTTITAAEEPQEINSVWLRQRGNANVSSLAKLWEPRPTGAVCLRGDVCFADATAVTSCSHRITEAPPPGPNLEH